MNEFLCGNAKLFHFCALLQNHLRLYFNVFVFFVAGKTLAKLMHTQPADIQREVIAFYKLLVQIAKYIV